MYLANFFSSISFTKSLKKKFPIEYNAKAPNERDKTEKLEIYSVALRFQTTDGCSRSFAKRIEVKLLTNHKTI